MQRCATSESAIMNLRHCGSHKLAEGSLSIRLTPPPITSDTLVNWIQPNAMWLSIALEISKVLKSKGLVFAQF